MDIEIRNGYQEPPVYEKINGKLAKMSRPNAGHIDVAGDLHFILKSHFKNKMCRVFSEIDVYLRDRDNFIPDLCVLCDVNKLKNGSIYGAPDLVVEILSRSTYKRDEGYKKDVYEECGVREYWIADPFMKRIKVYKLENGVYNLYDDRALMEDKDYDNLTDEDKQLHTLIVKSSVFSDLHVGLNDVFIDYDKTD